MDQPVDQQLKQLLLDLLIQCCAFLNIHHKTKLLLDIFVLEIFTKWNQLGETCGFCSKHSPDSSAPLSLH